MKKFLSAALAAVLVAVFCIAGSADAVSKGDFILNDSADWYDFRDDGTVTMAYNVADVFWANLGMTLKDAKYTEGGSYTVEVKTQLASNDEFTDTTGALNKGKFASVLALNTKEDTTNAAFLTGKLVIKLVDYTDDPTYGLGSATNLGTVVEIFDFTRPAGEQAVPLREGVTFDELNIKNGDGIYNTVRAEVKNYKASIYVNGVLILENYDLSAGSSAGELITVGMSGNSPKITDKTRLTAFKDLVVADGNGKVTYSTSAEYSVGDDYRGSASSETETPSSAPDTTVSSSAPVSSAPSKVSSAASSASQNSGCGNRAE